MKTHLAYTSLLLITLLSCGRIGGITTDSSKDPEGAITLNLRHDVTGWQHTIETFRFESEKGDALSFHSNTAYVLLGVDKYNNLDPGFYADRGSRNAMIVSAGKGTGLTAINTEQIPTSGWSESMAAQIGHLYIAKYTITWAEIEETYYYGIRVVDSIVSTENGILIPGQGWL